MLEYSFNRNRNRKTLMHYGNGDVEHRRRSPTGRRLCGPLAGRGGAGRCRCRRRSGTMQLRRSSQPETNVLGHVPVHRVREQLDHEVRELTPTKDHGGRTTRSNNSWTTRSESCASTRCTRTGSGLRSRPGTAYDRTYTCDATSRPADSNNAEALASCQ